MSIAGTMKLLFFQPNGIGNTILPTPLMQAIRHLYPTATYQLLIHPAGHPVLKRWSLFDNVITDDGPFDADGYDVVVLAEPPKSRVTA
jgi:ADP-heptose:LPS heptosyltransferase